MLTMLYARQSGVKHDEGVRMNHHLYEEARIARRPEVYFPYVDGFVYVVSAWMKC
jgi:hypothetical protein